MERAIEILFRKLEEGGKTGRAAAEALVSQARRKGVAMAPYENRIAKYLSCPDPDIRASAAQMLGHLKSESAIGTLESLLLSLSPEELRTECSDGPFYDCILSGIENAENATAARALLRGVLSTSLPQRVRACAMEKLYYVLCYLDLEDEGITIPEELTDVLEEYAASPDGRVSEAAIRLLGEL